MNNDSIFLYIIAAAAVVYAIGNAYGFFVKRARCTVTEGTVYSIWTPGPEKMRFRNSKWAKIAYKVNGKRYIFYTLLIIIILSISLSCYSCMYFYIFINI